MNSERRFFAASIISLLATRSISPTAAGSPSAPPNFTIILADGLGHGDIGPFGDTVHLTPNLDRLAATGVKLTSLYAAPVRKDRVVDRSRLAGSCPFPM